MRPGMAVGLTVGVTSVGTGNETLELLARGLLTGLGLGIVQAYLLQKFDRAMDADGGHLVGAGVAYYQSCYHAKHR